MLVPDLFTIVFSLLKAIARIFEFCATTWQSFFPLFRFIVVWKKSQIREGDLIFQLENQHKKGVVKYFHLTLLLFANVCINDIKKGTLSQSQPAKTNSFFFFNAGLFLLLHDNEQKRYIREKLDVYDIMYFGRNNKDKYTHVYEALQSSQEKEWTAW